MPIVAPDILAAAHGLSIVLCAVGLVTGLLLWVTGWWWHRFWIVLCTTVVAGIVGLITTPLHGMEKPLVAGLLLAVAAGVLALALVRLVVFAAGGGAACLAAHFLVPAGWNEPLVWFLSGGLVGLFLFRFCTMSLTSFAGTTLAGYSLLCLLDRLGRFDAVDLAERKAALLNAGIITMTLAGVAIQFYLERRRLRKQLAKEEQLRQIEEREQEMLYGRRSWLNWRRYRRAG